jgi:hypothetical protein
MSLVIALSGGKEAIIGGDKRNITFLGSCIDLEEELYQGRIKTDEDLMRRAKELGASFQVTDGREKVWSKGDVLVGEVTEITPTLDTRRRIYVTPGAFLLVDVEGHEARIAKKGNFACIVLGNKFTKELANEGIKNARGKITKDIIRGILAEAGFRTASVSPEYTVLCTAKASQDPAILVLNAFKEDCEKSGWRTCS